MTLEFDVAPTAPLELRDLSYEWARVPLDENGLAFLANGDLGGYSLNKDAHRGADSYSSNPRDAGLRMTLPGERRQIIHSFLCGFVVRLMLVLL